MLFRLDAQFALFTFELVKTKESCEYNLINLITFITNKRANKRVICVNNGLSYSIQWLSLWILVWILIFHWSILNFKSVFSQPQLRVWLFPFAQNAYNLHNRIQFYTHIFDLPSIFHVIKHFDWPQFRDY